jgi:hypothetical protein
MGYQQITVINGATGKAGERVEKVPDLVRKKKKAFDMGFS